MAVDFDKVGAGQFAAAAQEYFLRQPDGSLAKDRATAASLQGFLLALLVQAGEAKAAAEAIPESFGTAITRGRLLIEIRVIEAELLHMLDICNVYIAKGLFNETGGAVYWCVTSPLLLGWRGNEDCTGVDPKQKRSTLALSGAAVRALRQAEELSDFDASQSVGLLTEYMLESAKNLPETLKDVSVWVEDALENAADYVKKQAGQIVGRQMVATAIGLGIIGVAGVLYLKK